MPEPGGQEPERGGQEGAGIPKETGCMPVTREVVDRALGHIAEDPDRILLETGLTMSTENPALDRGLNLLGERTVDVAGRGLFLDGSLSAYRVLQEQAQARGQQVPIVTEEDWRLHLMEQIQNNRQTPGSHPVERLTAQMEQIRAGDPEFGRAIDDLIRYRTYKPFFLQGAVNTYLPIQKAQAAGSADQELFRGQ